MAISRTDDSATESWESVAYFSMEIGLEKSIPTYAGGLGVLAGDTVRSAADMSVPLVAVSLVHRKGYFRQRLDAAGNQTEEPVDWPVAERLASVAPRVTVAIERRSVQLRAWRYDVRGISGHVVPVLFLDADLPENAAEDRCLTDHLYGGDTRYRLCQEVILGIGGVRMLRALGYRNIRRFHMNEGHAGLLTLELAHEKARERGETTITREVVQMVKPLCVFTTHTPVIAGHDQFPLDMVARVITGYGHDFDERAREFCLDGVLNMTQLALNHSHYVNGVAKRHGEVARQMFAQRTIDSITNGVHAATWAAPPVQTMLDRHIPDWRQDNAGLRHALGIPKLELWEAHTSAKHELIKCVNETTGAAMDPKVFTIGFARRATAWKRADLLFCDIARLEAIHERVGAVQLICGGKAHPNDEVGKALIRRIFEVKAALGQKIRLVYLEEYDMRLARLITAGVDLWLNTPQPPLEASGTSGMKAAINGVPSLSILDGWWVEGCIEGVTGWAIGDDGGVESDPDHAADAASLYGKLEHLILPMFYAERDRYIEVMRHALAINGSFFNTERMLEQYMRKAYFA
ncbi:MAG TPA: alpha-glucan family phosphorylase [Casimicrobiaceae bacterium]|jgi:starch phosphorylase